jgi:hypothetical protein
MVEITIWHKLQFRAPFCHVLCLRVDSDVMLRFIVQALQEPPLCSSTVGNTRSSREKATVFYSIVHFYRNSSEHKSGGQWIRRVDTKLQNKDNFLIGDASCPTKIKVKERMPYIFPNYSDGEKSHKKWRVGDTERARVRLRLTSPVCLDPFVAYIRTCCGVEAFYNIVNVCVGGGGEPK